MLNVHVYSYLMKSHFFPMVHCINNPRINHNLQPILLAALDTTITSPTPGFLSKFAPWSEIVYISLTIEISLIHCSKILWVWPAKWETLTLNSNRVRKTKKALQGSPRICDPGLFHQTMLQIMYMQMEKKNPAKYQTIYIAQFSI